MGKFKINLFEIIPSEDFLQLNYAEVLDTRLVHYLRRLGIHVAFMSNDFAGLRKGTYFYLKDVSFEELKKKAKDTMKEKIDEVLNSLKMLELAEISLMNIPSTSYVVKHFITEILRQKTETLKEQQLVLPTRRTRYEAIEFCFNKTIFESAPYNLFKLYNCCALRVQHIDGKLYLQVTIFARISSEAKLESIIQILGNNLKTDQLIGLPVSIVNGGITGRYGYITKVSPMESAKSFIFIVKTQKGDLQKDARDLILNCTFTKARMFISKVLGEDLETFEKRRSYLTVKDPLSKLDDIMKILPEIQKLFFPIEVSNVQFSLSPNLLEVEAIEEKI